MATSPLAPVQSSSVAQIGYDAASQEFHVQFRPGKAVYIYPEVDNDTAQQITTADSVGKMVQALLVGREFRKVDPPSDDEAGVNG